MSDKFAHSGTKIAPIVTISFVDAPDVTLKASSFQTEDPGLSTFRTSAGAFVATFPKESITRVVFGHPEAPEDRRWVLINTKSTIDWARRKAAREAAATVGA